jgi:hypothetical protein
MSTPTAQGERPAKVRCTWIETRGASPADPGEIVLIYYLVDGTTLVLTDAQGQPSKDVVGAPWRQSFEPGDDPALVAKRLAWRASHPGPDRFNGPLFYDTAVIV